MTRLRLVLGSSARAITLAVSAIAAACAEPSDALDDGRAPVEGACEDIDTTEDEDPWADCVDAFEPAEGVSFGHDAMPEIVLGPPQGGGELMGGTDTASLGCGGSITLGFVEPWPVDGPGPDLVVFENAFRSGEITFVEPAQVLVSEDGEDWRSFPCEPDGGDEPPAGCAGLRPVLAAEPDEPVDPSAVGGDAFDLADVGLAEARWVRLIDRTAEHYGSQTWCLGAAGGFDLDAIAAVEGAP
jgi:hypothetical protein